MQKFSDFYAIERKNKVHVHYPMRSGYFEINDGWLDITMDYEPFAKDLSLNGGKFESIRFICSGSEHLYYLGKYKDRPLNGDCVSFRL